ncbi:hypothetical protein ACFSO0_03870 [Brevibacillus sp. GCM10020057]|uniref:hypothetical protein n=1 Tax=Brevibacillus sp. GCM10020057 TaxID=3317327 RepID=UPI003634340D
MQSEEEKNLYQIDGQTVSLIKDIRHNVHNVIKDHLEKKVRIEAIDGQIFEGVIVDYDDQNVYVEVEDPDAEIDDLEVEEVASRQPYGGDWGGGYPGWNPYGGPSPYGDISPFSGGTPYQGFGPFGSSSYPYGQMNPYGPFGAGPFGSSSNPYGQFGPFGSSSAPGYPQQNENAPFSQVSPYTDHNYPTQVSPFGGQNPYFSPFPPFSPFPQPMPCIPFFPPPPPPPPPVGPQAAVIIPPRRRRRPCRRGRKIIPLALFTLLTIALL